MFLCVTRWLHAHLNLHHSFKVTCSHCCLSVRGISSVMQSLANAWSISGHLVKVDHYDQQLEWAAVCSHLCLFASSAVWRNNRVWRRPAAALPTNLNLQWSTTIGQTDSLSISYRRDLKLADYASIAQTYCDLDFEIHIWAFVGHYWLSKYSNTLDANLLTLTTCGQLPRNKRTQRRKLYSCTDIAVKVTLVCREWN